jgi:hypothetical protein
MPNEYTLKGFLRQLERGRAGAEREPEVLSAIKFTDEIGYPYPVTQVTGLDLLDAELLQEVLLRLSAHKRQGLRKQSDVEALVRLGV